MFIHDALVEAILSRDTLVKSEHLHTYVSNLLIPGATGRTRMDKQFKVKEPSLYVCKTVPLQLLNASQPFCVSVDQSASGEAHRLQHCP